MISRSRRITRSFSFRLTLIAFLIFLAILVLLRVVIYQRATQEAEHEVRQVLQERFGEIDTARAENGVDGALNIISTIMAGDDEGLFALAYADAIGIVREGNVIAIPKPQEHKGNYFHFTLTRGDDERHYLGRIATYPDGGQLLVAYDLRHVERIDAILGQGVVETLVLSLVSALVCAAFITYLINRRLRDLNATCRSLVRGDMAARARIDGSGDEFDQLAKNFNYMLAWIDRLIVGIRGATDNLAHDMRTPLARHRIRLQSLLHREDISGEPKAQVEQAMAEIDRLVELFNAILSISRAESKSDVSHFAAFPISRLIEDVREVYDGFAEVKGIALSAAVPEGLELLGDRQLVAQAIANLLDNAIKYTPAGGQVLIHALTEGGKLRLSVEDSGPGIPPELYGRVVERFYRMEESRTTPGTGLGLSLVSAVAELHGGKLVFSGRNDGKTGLVATLVLRGLQQ